MKYFTFHKRNLILLAVLLLMLAGQSFTAYSAEEEGAEIESAEDNSAQDTESASSNSESNSQSSSQSSSEEQTKATEDRFIPSTRISEDLSVSFPVNI